MGLLHSPRHENCVFMTTYIPDPVPGWHTAIPSRPGRDIGMFPSETVSLRSVNGVLVASHRRLAAWDAPGLVTPPVRFIRRRRRSPSVPARSAITCAVRARNVRCARASLAGRYDFNRGSADPRYLPGIIRLSNNLTFIRGLLHKSQRKKRVN